MRQVASSYAWRLKAWLAGGGVVIESARSCVQCAGPAIVRDVRSDLAHDGSVRWAAAILALACLGCDDGRPAIVVTVSDPDRIARTATSLVVSSTIAGAGEAIDLGRHEFPLTFALTSERPSSGPLVVEALRAGERLAIGRTDVRIEAGGAPASVVLREPCIDSCEDGIFCNGQEQCSGGFCENGPPPCPDLGLPCLASMCLEELRACTIEAAPGLDDLNPCTSDRCTAEGILHTVEPDGTTCTTSSVSGTCSSGLCTGG